jgi:hypothetical protein
MKRFGLIAAALGLTGVVYVLGPGKSPSPALANPPGSQRSPAPAAVTIDPAELFRRAFWQRPGTGDKILHAERREWTDAAGLKQWQWFLVVEPSPELVKYLRDDNAFGLVRGSVGVLDPEAPSWFVFKPDEFSIFQSPHAGMRLMFSKTDNVLYATDSGRGFTKGAPEPAKQAAPPTASGRLPTTPPPISKP